MGSLSNLYISQSYISLLHLGSNNTASSTFTEIEDGLGNGIGISVNTEGDLFVSNQLEVDRTAIFSGSVKINTAYTSSTPSYVNSGNQFTNNIVRITGSFASGSATSPTVNEVQIGWPVYGNGLVSGAVVTNKQYVNSQFVELTINQNTIQWFGNYYFTNPQTFYDNVSVSGSQDITGSLWVRDKITATDISASNSISASNLYVRGRISAYELDVTIESSSIIFTSGSNILGDEANIDTQTLIGRVIVSGSLEVTGSTRINGNTTISGSTIISGSSNLIGTTTINGNTTITGSLILSSSAETELNVIGNTIITGSTTITGSLNVTGSINVTGSMIYSGSVRGQVLPITISASTASLDCSLGNFFTLNLTAGTTRLIPTNINPGSTISLKVTQASSPGILIFNNVLFASGAYYSPTQINGAVDILTFISYDTSSLYAVGANSFTLT
jgi:hypothetical protein